MRYLEQCISNLKTAHRRDSPSSVVSETTPPPLRQMREDDEDEDEDNQEEEDEEMEDAVSPTYVDNAVPKSTYHFANASSDRRSVCSHSTTTSPAILPHDHRGHYSANPSPALRPSDPHHYSLTSSSVRSTVTSPSIHPSPAFSAHTPSATLFSNPFHNGPPSTGPIAAPGSSHSTAPFSLGPPADREDHEATEALLMLNTDRRSWSGARGMSVKDLLSG